MRKLLAAGLALPVLTIVYLGSVIAAAARRRRRTIPALLAMAFVGALVLGVGRPAPAVGRPPTHVTQLPPSELMTAVETGQSPIAAITVSFPRRMNEGSVAALLTVEPAQLYDATWDATGTLLTIRPRTTWAPGILHTITVDAGALDADGQPLDHRVRASFLTRPPTTATIGVTATSRGIASTASHIRIAFNGPVDATTMGLGIEPAIAGHLQAAADGTPEAPVFEFVPDQPLAAGATYSVSLAPGVADVDGAPITAAAITIRMASAPTVVRFHPLDRATGVAWSQDLSVRFTQPMDHASTQAAWSASQAGSKLGGAFSWAAGDTVMIFNPSTALGYGQKVVLSVGTGATSQAGLALAAASTASFTTAARPTRAAKPVSFGGSIGGSTWAAVEAYYLKLMNCTRTGGWVTSTGACSSPGGRNVAPLWQDPGITAKVSRPYAKKLAVLNICTHFSGGTPGDRLRAAGYTSWNWAENIGCLTGNPYAAVLSTHLYFQNEKSTNGGHYVNMMNALYDRCGIGVWVYANRVRLVIDFYKPL